MPEQGNILSFLVLFLWIPISLWGARRWPPAKAAALLLVGAILFLPQRVAFKVPGLPEFGKTEIVIFWLAIAMLMFHQYRVRTVPLGRTLKVLLVLLVLGPAVTILLNRDFISFGSVALPGHSIHDMVHFVAGALFRAGLPFVLAAAMFRGPDDLRVLFRVLVGAGLVYSVLQLVELALSPQLHRWVYGFHPSDFVQMMRGGGYRPMVFMGHALTVSMFTFLAALASTVLERLNERIFGVRALWAAAWLMLILLVSKSVAPFVYCMVAVPLALFGSPKLQVRIAAVLALLALAYPIFRAADLVPVESIKEFAVQQWGEARGGSLMFRFENEAELLERARERIWFGWGGYCRGCIFEPWSGSMISVLDGEWIIALNTFGIIGFVGRFGILVLPVFFCWRYLQRVPRRSSRILLASLAMIVGFFAINLLPNSSNYITFVLSGALYGSMHGALWQTAQLRAQKRANRLAAANQTRARGAQKALLCFLISLTALGSARAASPDAVGGGFADSGIEGAYYPNPNLDGEPSFTRRDVRIDFNWAGKYPVGGSTAIPYRNYPTNGFSIRWIGQIIPRFSESYLFFGDAEGGIRMRIRKIGEPTWTKLVDRREQNGPYASKAIALSSGQLYDIEIEYRAIGGNAECTVKWKSDSTPPEVIDPVVQQGLNAANWGKYTWADLVKSARYGDDPHVDEEGWPTTSGVGLVASEMHVEDSELRGTYLLTFRGEAQVEQQCCNEPIFRVGERSFERTLPKGLGYERSSNTTSGLMTVNGSRFMLYFNEAQRAPNERDNGVTKIQLMRPIAPGSREHHRLDEVVYRPFKKAVAPHFTTLRWEAGASADLSGHWADRTLPDYAFFATQAGQENWEYLIMLANETGKDLYISTPIAADDGYFKKLALLLRYGSDGREPYSAPTPNPVYPPLNLNLRVYVEVGNEIWNWTFASTQVAQRLSRAEKEAGSETWKAIDFDGRAGNPEHLGAVRRWHALRTVACSNAFREVFGDEKMGSRVRPLLEYQYDNYQDTAILSLDFLDSYLGNRAERHVEDPHPVSHYVWGAGGATYYGLANKDGAQSEIVARRASFEAPTLEPNTLKLRPQGTPWTFRGQAGLIHPAGAERIDGLTRPPSPKSGKQAGFIMGRGEISQSVRFTRPGVYAITFNAAGSGQKWPGYLAFDLYVDEQKVSPRGQSDPRVADEHAALDGWGRNTSSLEEEWGSAVFEVEAPGERTIRFVGRGEPDDYLLLDNIRVASLDALMKSGFDTGEAQGQVGEANYARQLQGQAKYARAFGLQVIGYEAGWSLGGDFLQLPIQTWAKLYDPRAQAINNRAAQLWAESGSFMNVWGVFIYWPSWDFQNAGGYSIMRSIRESARSLPSEATYGVPLPAVLRPDDADLSRTNRVKKSDMAWWRRALPCAGEVKDDWYSWMVIAPTTGTFSMEVEGKGSGSMVIELDGQVVVRFDSLQGSEPTSQLPMTKGAHALRAVVVGDIELSELRITERP